VIQEFPTESYQRYLKNPHFCPHCSGNNIGLVDDLNRTGVDFVTQTIGCMDCHKLWVELYSLTSIEPHS